MHINYIRPGGVAYDLPLGLLDDIYDWVVKLPQRIDELEDMLTENRIWKVHWIFSFYFLFGFLSAFYRYLVCLVESFNIYNFRLVQLILDAFLQLTLLNTDFPVLCFEVQELNGMFVRHRRTKLTIRLNLMCQLVLKAIATIGKFISSMYLINFFFNYSISIEFFFFSLFSFAKKLVLSLCFIFGQCLSMSSLIYRYLCRLEEIRQSMKIIHQCLNKMPQGEVKIDDFKISSPKRSDMKVIIGINFKKINENNKIINRFSNILNLSDFFKIF